ncbi:hypothetical protein EC843_105117 [Buttiauxella sp. JUb87]|nr:hypothetical protein EC843_105117 [Buttiauxella sp. JUb87]
MELSVTGRILRSFRSFDLTRHPPRRCFNITISHFYIPQLLT